MTTDYHTPYVASVTSFRAVEMNAPLAELDAAIGGKAATAHTHDDRYYTEDEMDTMLLGLGEGDVSGPATNTDGSIPQWNGADSKTLKDGLSVVTTVADPGVDTAVPTEQAVREAINAATGGGSQPYIIGGSYMGKPTASLVMVIHPASIDFTLPAGLANSKLRAKDAATAETVFSLRNNGVEFGTATFAAAGVVATFAAASASAFVEADDDYFELVAPATPDATLGRIGWSILGTR